MKNLKSSRLIFFLTLIFYVLQNTYFGWNKIPMSEAELNCDHIVKIGLFISAGFYISCLMNVPLPFTELSQIYQFSLYSFGNS